jgi:polyhydroxybutyrate depolymerase
MPILFIHGTADPVTPYAGGRQPGGAEVLSAEDTVKVWVHFNGCNESPEIQEIHGLNGTTLVFVFTHASCQKHSQVKHYRIEGGGHVWPGEPEDISRSGAAKTRRKIDASEEIWKFFESVSKVEKGKYTR